MNLRKEYFHYGETKPVFELIEETAQRSGVSRSQAFEDFLQMSLCALSGGRMEDQYLEAVKRHTVGKPGKRGCDSIAEGFGALIVAMEKTRHDILGDLFQGAISYGENSQYLTPEPICHVMACLTIDVQSDDGSAKRSACDPCCGSGRMLLAVADLQPHWELIGQDIDLRCVRMTTINLALRNLYGFVVWGNTLALEKRLIYRTGFNLRGFVREIPLEECPAQIEQTLGGGSVGHTPIVDETTNEQSVEKIADDDPGPPGTQLRLF